MLAAMPLPPTTTPPGDETPVRGRDDACPGALRLHPADDGSLARIRVPGGLLTARQAEALGRVSEELGDGRLDITSRGNAQVRGLAAGCGAELAARLRTAGLLPSDRHDRVRNIVASPLSGLDGRGHADVVAWVRELDAALCDDTPTGPAGRGELSALSGLSGRFLFALDDGRGDVTALGADVTLIATADGGAVLRCGGPLPGPGVSPPSGATHPDTAARRARRTDGSDPLGRGAEANTGGAGAASLATDGSMAGGGGLRVRGEDAPRAAALAAVEFLTRVRESGTRAWRVRELPAEHAVTTGGLAARLAGAGIEAVPVEHTPAPASAAPPAPGSVPGPNGRHALSIALPLGRVSAAQWRLLTTLASRGGADELRMTPWRGVVLPGFAPDDAPGALSELAGAGLVTTPDSPWLGVGACTGRPGCAKSLADVRADAARMVADVTRGRAAGTGRVAAGAADTPNTAGASANTAGAVADPAGAVARTAGAVVDPAGAVMDPAGAVMDPARRDADSGHVDIGHVVVSGSPPWPVSGTTSGGGRAGPEPLPVYVSGCERRCGHPGDRWVDALAIGDMAYRVTVRGAGGDTPETDSVDVTAEQLAGAVAAARGTT
ncbi:nitrite reductase [Streptomyces malaysiensis subsp. malaysiensis]|uniref:Nitrite reductase n=1 Tax=Streptomyces malaysiensis TaxID=92644 RepID=A0ABX6WL55_STRMQ|nr:MULTISPECIES: nitrite reductase [Streptomyces]QPI62178.1 nitrite reductase [Streptomyces solisilvae]UHH23775.1 nitrite reductase [Streptomyces sp. HNM0561]